MLVSCVPTPATRVSRFPSLQLAWHKGFQPTSRQPGLSKPQALGHLPRGRSRCSGKEAKPQAPGSRSERANRTARDTHPHTITHRRNQRSPRPYLRPQIPERGHRQRGNFRSSITVVATTCRWGKTGQ